MDKIILALLGRRKNDTDKKDAIQDGEIKNDYDDENNVEDSHPDFIIPVSVHVTDINDNTPQFVGKAPYHLNISELILVSATN